VTLLNCLSILVVNLPKIIRLIEEIERARAQQALDQKVMDDKRAISEAFRNRDPDALRRVFES